MTQPTLFDLHPNEYSQELCYYPFAVNLHRCAGSGNTLDDLSSRVCVPSKVEDLNLHVLNLITGINELRTLTNIYHANVNISLMVENITWIKSGIATSVGLSVKIWKNIVCAKKVIFRILQHVAPKMGHM